MATMTNPQIEQKKQLLAEKMKEMKALYGELVEAGAIEIPEEDLEKAAGGGYANPWLEPDRPPVPLKPPKPEPPSWYVARVG